VISAPFTPGGGAIYIYHGSLHGIKNPSQVVTAADLSIPGLKSFGASLSAGLDLDKNEYPDILVGAYTSSKAILLRSRPVVDVESTVVAEPQFVNYPDDTRFHITVCLRYHGRNVPLKLVFIYNLTVDESRTKAGLNSRAVFRHSSHGNSIKRRNMTLHFLNRTCTSFALKLRNRIFDIVSPIIATLTYQIQEEMEMNSSNGNPNTSQSLFPVLRSQAIHSVSTETYLLRGCGSDNKCIPDLQIFSPQVNISGEQRDYFVLGSVSEIVVAVTVRNTGESAYDARLIATFPHELMFLSSTNNRVSCGSGSHNDDKIQVTCALGNPLENQFVSGEFFAE
jgi:integrin alpha 8